MFLENLDSCTSLGFELFICRYLLCKDRWEKNTNQKKKIKINKKTPQTEKKEKNTQILFQIS